MNDKHLQVEIVTPEGTIYSGSAQAVSLPGGLAPFQVLVNHAPIISTLELGAIRIVDSDGYEHVFAVTGGFVEVKNNHVSIVAEEVIPAEQIDVVRYQSERQRLLDQLEGETDLHRRAELSSQLKRVETFLKIATRSVAA